MRPVLFGDMVSATRALLCAPVGRRWLLARSMLDEADAADRYLRRLGRAHPRWGNGTLMARASRLPLAPEPGFQNADYVECLILMLEALRRRRTGLRTQRVPR
ncbi:hypothetical protein [Puniceibacterium sp. IMCC21224]|uniref:DUF7742 family protein n=1 Tax=Puniceibacterium sp. IMCC21224 TaxID=1618204 RepID=UPI00064E0293|nr:hypothetical protein [Puniceibacterium sp. IMCC21224]KMK67700.1 hypothetical protein IMCC21224_112572 [Puniceibacterium sp. IMCC21224]